MICLPEAEFKMFLELAGFILLPFNLFSLGRMIKTAQRDEFNWGYKTTAPIE